MKVSDKISVSEMEKNQLTAKILGCMCRKHTYIC